MRFIMMRSSPVTLGHRITAGQRDGMVAVNASITTERTVETVQTVETTEKLSRDF